MVHRRTAGPGVQMPSPDAGHGLRQRKAKAMRAVFPFPRERPSSLGPQHHIRFAQRCQRIHRFLNWRPVAGGLCHLEPTKQRLTFCFTQRPHPADGVALVRETRGHEAFGQHRLHHARSSAQVTQGVEGKRRHAPGHVARSARRGHQCCHLGGRGWGQVDHPAVRSMEHPTTVVRVGVRVPARSAANASRKSC